MSAINKGTAGDALEAKETIEQRIQAGTPAPAAPRRLSCADIVMVPAIFQPRSGGEWQSESHINTLRTGIGNAQGTKGRGKLAPVLIYWIGDAWACLDGHHRLAAIAATKGGQAATVAVEVFSGTLKEAMLEATRRNSQNKLPMLEADKSERAWKLLLLESGTHAAIAEACGTSTKTVSRMAAVIRKWAAKPDGLATIRTFKWWQARLYNGGGTEETSYDADAVRADRIDRQREALGKVIKDNHPAIVGDALLLLDPALATALMHHFRDHFRRESLFPSADLDRGDWPLPFPPDDKDEF